MRKSLINVLKSFIFLVFLGQINPSFAQTTTSPEITTGKQTVTLQVDNPSPPEKQSAEDFYMPVITMEKLHGHHPYWPRYRIEIYKNGRGYFYGMRDVKILGEVEFWLPEDKVTNLMHQIDDLKFWQMSNELPDEFGRLEYQLSVRKGGVQKEILSYGGPQVSAFHKAIENTIFSFQWRCPHVNKITRDDACKKETNALSEDKKQYLRSINQEKENLK